MNKSKSKNKNNPEILREKKEQQGYDRMYNEINEGEYPEYSFGSTLFPDYFHSNAASSTEATGLMQTIPTDNAQLESYYALYNYCLTEPVVPEE